MEFQIIGFKHRRNKFFHDLNVLVPNWAHWGCVNQSGELWVFEKKPMLGIYLTSFYHGHTRNECLGTIMYKGYWKESLCKLIVNKSLTFASQ